MARAAQRAAALAAALLALATLLLAVLGEQVLDAGIAHVTFEDRPPGQSLPQPPSSWSSEASLTDRRGSVSSLRLPPLTAGVFGDCIEPELCCNGVCVSAFSAPAGCGGGSGSQEAPDLQGEAVQARGARLAVAQGAHWTFQAGAVKREGRVQFQMTSRNL
eukprot:SM000201S05916  [mRNA]  locus=s201:2336:6140:- [translate_table: standard]